MNKKFSTLVAALLVSGVSYAVVGTFNSPALTNSPIAKAAAANLRAVAVDGYDLGITATYADGVKWMAAGNEAAGYTLKTVSKGSYLAKSNDPGKVILLPSDKATDLISFKVEATTGHLKTADGESVYINKADGSLVYSTKAINLSTQYYAGLFTSELGNGLVTATVPTASSLTIAAIIEKSNIITNSQNVIKFTADVSPVKMDLAGSNLNNGSEPTKLSALYAGNGNSVAVEEVSGVKLLTITSTKGTKFYVIANESQKAVTLESEMPTDVKTIARSEVTATTQDGFGYVTIGGKALNENSSFSLGNYADGQTVFFADETSAKTETLCTALPTGTAKLVKVLTNLTSFSSNGTGDIVKLTITPGTFATEAFSSAALGDNKFTLSANDDEFALSSSFEYMLAAADNKSTEQSDAIKFTLDASEYGVIKSGNKYLVKNNSATTLELKETLVEGDSKLYLYDASSNVTTPVTSIADLKTVLIGEKNTVVLDLTNEGSQIITANETVTPDVPVVGVPQKLTEGGNYYLDDATGDNLLIPTANGKSLTNMSKSAVTDASVAGLWKVTAAKWNTEGVATHYQFTYRANDKYALAFDVKFDKLAETWSAVYNPEGKYNTFFVDEAGYVSFVADETTQVKDKSYTNKDRWALKFDGTIWSMAVYDENSEKLKVTEVKDIVVTGKDVAEQVEWLNVTAGTGSGFGVAYVVNEKKVTLESNVLTEGVTAVQGPKFTGISGNDYSDKMFIKISGDYEYKDLSSLSGDKLKDASKALLSDFRASDFVAVDTVLYSKLIADNTNYYYLVSVKGSDMVTTEGKDANDASYANLIDKNSKFYSLKRRVENAMFAVYHPKGSTIEDPVYIKAPYVKMPLEYNEKGLVNSDSYDGYEDAAPLYVAIKNYDKKYYVGAANEYSNVFITKNNDVDFNDVNGIVNIISRNYKTDGQVYANLDKGNIGLVLPKYVSLDKPEGQYLVTGGNYNKYGEIQSFTFTNRESGRSTFVMTGLDGKSDNVSAIALKKTDKDNIYSVVGQNDTIEIQSVDLTSEYVGYKNYAKEDLDNTEYVLKVVSKAGNVDDLYITEDHNKDHSLGLNADTLETATFKLIKFEDAKTAANGKAYGDTVFVSQHAYSYVTDKEEYAEDKNDRVVAFTYAIYNADNMEFLAAKKQGATLEDYFYCNPDLKYSGAKAAENATVAQRFIIKEKADGTCQLIPIKHINDAAKNIFTVEGKEYFVDNEGLAESKLYAGISDNKIHKEGTIYKIADNDLFRIVEVGAPMYRRLEATAFDTIRIYKDNMTNVALFAESAKKELLSGEHFLGMAHKADKDEKNTMFSFFVDTAFVRNDTKKPQYLLAIDATTANKLESCDHPQDHGYHDTGVIDTVYGKFLVNLVDSATLWEVSKKHDNPYMWESYPRLGFVKAKHTNDKLIIEKATSVKADTISLAENKDRVATFAFRIVDQDSKSFKMETAGGWVKWLNGVPVVVNDIDMAEVFNLEATSNDPVANESIATSSIKVIAGNGVVTVIGAQGKQVAITNVLGQTIANTVLSSSEATIAAPAGIVVVAVEGEAAVKAIVK